VGATRTHACRSQTGQRQSISAASAVSARGEFWFCTYKGGLNGELFVELLAQIDASSKKPVYLIIDGLPAHKRTLVRDYVAATRGKLSLYFLPAMRRTSTRMSLFGVTSNGPERTSPSPKSEKLNEEN